MRRFVRWCQRSRLVALAVEDVALVALAGELPRDVLDDVVLVVGPRAVQVHEGVVHDVDRGRGPDPGVVKGVGDNEGGGAALRRGDLNLETAVSLFVRVRGE